MPRSALSAVSSPHGALANARAAAAALTEQISLRRSLAPAPIGASPEPGQLTKLSTAACWELLGESGVGRLAYIARAGVPDIVPVNYAVVGGDLVLRCGPGPKLQAADRGDTVAFEADDLHASTRSGWSVVVSGRASRLSAEELRRMTVLQRPWASGPRLAGVRIRPTRISGRRLS